MKDNLGEEKEFDPKDYEYLRKPKPTLPARPLGSIVKEHLSRYGLEKKMEKVSVKQAYIKVMGEGISGVTKKCFIDKNGVLFLRIDNSVLQQEMFNQRTVLVNLLNEEIEKEVVKEIRFIQ